MHNAFALPSRQSFRKLVELKVNKSSIAQSTLTDRFQTTVPAPVRKALNLKKRDKLNFTLLDNGNVMICRAEEDAADPVFEGFLSFLEQDMSVNPENIHALSASQKSHVDSLIANVDIDLDSPLVDEDD